MGSTSCQGALSLDLRDRRGTYLSFGRVAKRLYSLLSPDCRHPNTSRVSRYQRVRWLATVGSLVACLSTAGQESREARKPTAPMGLLGTCICMPELPTGEATLALSAGASWQFPLRVAPLATSCLGSARFPFPPAERVLSTAIDTYSASVHGSAVQGSPYSYKKCPKPHPWRAPKDRALVHIFPCVDW